MGENESLVNKEKISRLITRMLELILEVKIETPDEELVKHYIKLVSRFDDENPIKDLLLLKKSFIESHTDIYVNPSLTLAGFKDGDII
jgi:hypothetical protein